MNYFMVLFIAALALANEPSLKTTKDKLYPGIIYELRPRLDEPVTPILWKLQPPPLANCPCTIFAIAELERLVLTEFDTEFNKLL